MGDYNYECLLAHIEHHHVRQWLLDGAMREKAHTIEMAIRRMSSSQLARGMARMLAAQPADWRSEAGWHRD